MGQAGAQREPSMEEILASIRRIIENNEPGSDGNPMDAGESFSQHDADENAYDADYAEQDCENQLTAANDVPVAEPVSLADVAARARAVPEAHSTEAARTELGDQFPDSAAEVMDAAAEELREALVSDEPVEAVAQPGVAVDARQQDEVVAPQPEAVKSNASSDHRAPPVDQQQGGVQLVSLQTGEKVAAAFGELDAAIAAGQRRSFDEIAEEMLRPMLTQWLDDNLPTLVERLVREEIERVSRGTQR